MTTSQAINLSWTDNSDNEDGFHIERSANGSSFEIIGSTAENATTFQDLSIQTNNTYTYRVCAYNEFGRSGYTNTVEHQEINTAPTIQAIADMSIEIGGGETFATFDVYDNESPANALTVTVSSSNQILVPNSGLVVEGTGSTRVLNISPTADTAGESLISVQVSDGEYYSVQSFLFSVTEPTPPSIGIAAINSQDSEELYRNEPFLVSLDISDPDAIEYIEFHIDGALQATTYGEPFEAVLNLDQEGSAELTITATLSGSGEVLTISETLTLNPPLTESRIVDGIQSVDIGESADLGVTNYDRSIDAFFVSDHQGTIGNRNDSNRFAYLPVKGDFTLTARLSDFVDTNSESLAGLMVRASTKGNDVQASILISAAGSIRSVIRVEPRKRAIEQSYSTASPDFQYVRISRSGDQVSLETSPDNSNWTIVASNPVPLGSNALLGLAVAAGADSTSPTAIGVFDRVSLEGTIDTGDTGDTTGGGGSNGGGNPNSGKGKKK